MSVKIVAQDKESYLNIKSLLQQRSGGLVTINFLKVMENYFDNNNKNGELEIDLKNYRFIDVPDFIKLLKIFTTIKFRTYSS